MIIFSDKVYNVIKWVVLIVMPGLSTLVGTLGPSYGLTNSDLIVNTINALTVFLGAATGVSYIGYRNQDSTTTDYGNGQEFTDKEDK